MTFSQSDIDRVMREQGYKCYCCGRPFDNSMDGRPDVHHGVVTRDKRFSKWLDVAENAIIIRHKCHTTDHGRLSNYETRKRVYEWKKQFYDMEAWLDSIPMRSKERFDA